MMKIIYAPTAYILLQLSKSLVKIAIEEVLLAIEVYHYVSNIQTTEVCNFETTLSLFNFPPENVKSPLRIVWCWQQPTTFYLICCLTLCAIHICMKELWDAVFPHIRIHIDLRVESFLYCVACVALVSLPEYGKCSKKLLLHSLVCRKLSSSSLLIQFEIKTYLQWDERQRYQQSREIHWCWATLQDAKPNGQ